MDLAQIEMVGKWTCLIGAGVLAANARWSGWGFVLFLVSNLAWITAGAMRGIDDLWQMQVGLTITSLFGIYRWRVEERKRKLRVQC